MMATLVRHFGCPDAPHAQVKESIWRLRGVISTNSTFRTLINPSWLFEGSEMVSFGVD